MRSYAERTNYARDSVANGLDGHHVQMIIVIVREQQDVQSRNILRLMDV